MIISGVINIERMNINFKILQNKPFSSGTLGFLSGSVMVVSAVSIGGAEEGLGFVFGLVVLRIKDGVFGASGGFEASSSLNCEKYSVQWWKLLCRSVFT